MAVVAATFARGGSVSVPYLGCEIRGPAGDTVESHCSASSPQIIEADTSRTIAAAMVEVVHRGTVRAASLPGVIAAGKTGAATVPDGRSHPRFVAFAPAEPPRFVPNGRNLPRWSTNSYRSDTDRGGGSRR